MTNPSRRDRSLTRSAPRSSCSIKVSRIAAPAMMMSALMGFSPEIFFLSSRDKAQSLCVNFRSFG